MPRNEIFARAAYILMVLSAVCAILQLLLGSALLFMLVFGGGESLRTRWILGLLLAFLWFFFYMFLKSFKYLLNKKKHGVVCLLATGLIACEIWAYLSTNLAGIGRL
jgi:hypothetical protein